MPRESTIVRRIIAAVKKRYPTAVVWKIADRFARGRPDIIVFLPCMIANTYPNRYGGVLVIETKVPVGGVLSKIQEQTIRELRAAGAECIVATCVEDVMGKLEEMGAVN